MNQEIIRTRVRSRIITQKDLAEKASIQQAKFSRFMNGALELTKDEISRLRPLLRK